MMRTTVTYVGAEINVNHYLDESLGAYAFDNDILLIIKAIFLSVVACQG